MKNIPGQEKVRKILSGFIESGNIPHALLFSGLEGVGKEYVAIKFAQNSVNQSKDEIQKEKIKKRIELLTEPYVKFIFPLPRGKGETESTTPTEKLSSDEIDIIRDQIAQKIKNPYHKISVPKANTIKISSIRDINKFLALDYRDVSKRFILISNAHLMNEESQNALLKNLEEPPKNVIFILCTSQVNKLRRTIISRCWRINFDPLSEEDIVKILSDYFHIDVKTTAAVAPFAAGSVQAALQLINMDIFNLKEKTISVLRYSFGRKFNSAFEELNGLLNDQLSENYPIVIKMIVTWLNDLQKHRYNLKEFFFGDYEETLEKFNSKFPDVELSTVAVKLDRLASLTKNNINPSVLSANLILELSSVTSKN